MNKFCPAINRKKVVDSFNEIVEAFGGKPLTMDEFKSLEARDAREGIDKKAMQLAYRIWNLNQGVAISESANGAVLDTYNRSLQEGKSKLEAVGLAASVLFNNDAARKKQSRSRVDVTHGGVTVSMLQGDSSYAGQQFEAEDTMSAINAHQKWSKAKAENNTVMTVTAPSAGSAIIRAMRQNKLWSSLPHTAFATVKDGNKYRVIYSEPYIGDPSKTKELYDIIESAGNIFNPKRYTTTKPTATQISANMKYHTENGTGVFTNIDNYYKALMLWGKFANLHVHTINALAPEYKNERHIPLVKDFFIANGMTSAEFDNYVQLSNDGFSYTWLKPIYADSVEYTTYEDSDISLDDDVTDVVDIPREAVVMGAVSHNMTTDPNLDSYFEGKSTTNVSNILDTMSAHATRGEQYLINMLKGARLSHFQGVPVHSVTAAEIMALTGSKVPLAGYYDHKTGTIYIANDIAFDGPNGSAVQTVLHEVMHAALVDAVLSDTVAKENVVKLLGKARDAAARMYGKTWEELVKEDPSRFYGLTDIQEFLSEITNPKFVEFLKDSSLSDKGATSLFSKIISAIVDAWRSIFSTADLDPKDSLYSEVNDIINKLLAKDSS